MSVPTLMGLPFELREMILKFANFPIIHPRPIIPVDKNNGIAHEGADWNARHLWGMKYFRAAGTVDYHPTLVVNHRLYTETMEILRKNQRESIYPVDLMLVNDSELWMTWLSTPIIVDEVKGVYITFRNAGFVDGKKATDPDHRLRVILKRDDSHNHRFRRALSDIMLEILGRRFDGRYKDTTKRLRIGKLIIDVSYKDRARRTLPIPGQPFATVQNIRTSYSPVEVYLHPHDILIPISRHMACRLRPDDYIHEEHPITTSIYESIDLIEVTCHLNVRAQGHIHRRFYIDRYFRRLQYDGRWCYHPFFPEEVFKAWKASTQLIRWNM